MVFIIILQRPIPAALTPHGEISSSPRAPPDPPDRFPQPLNSLGFQDSPALLCLRQSKIFLQIDLPRAQREMVLLPHPVVKMEVAQPLPPPEVLLTTITPEKVSPDTAQPVKGTSTLPRKSSLAQKDRFVR